MDGIIFLLGIFLLAILVSVLVSIVNKQPSEEKIIMVDKAEFRAMQVVKYLQNNGEITNSEYRELTGVSEAQATRDFDELEKQGKVTQIGTTGHAVSYKLKDSETSSE